MSLAYTVNGITVTYLGRTEFAENSLPFLAESPDGGLDGLTRTFIGAAPLLEDFLEALAKGGSYEYNGEDYYLLNWQPNGGKLWPEVSLNYVGLSDGPPPPIGDDDVSVQSISISAEISDGVTAERTIDFLASQTTWRYITEERPTGVFVGYVANGINPVILRSVITITGGEDDGKRYAGANAPAEYVTATTPGIADTLLSLRATEVYGSPFFLCEEVIARMFVG